ncbi:MAG: cobyrinate a,c-diamide synthase [Deltaproteobacteria bacterium]|nr:cobyrinate a,c-diamide synthase [Deltaproteobacteria bacterium]
MARTTIRIPRLVIAGTGGDSGKTLVSLGLVHLLKKGGMRVSVFKKGPDYIDAAWLGLAGGVQMARNLDPYLMKTEKIMSAFTNSAQVTDMAIIEGNRGLCDGVTADGDYSTAFLASLLKTPVVLVLPVQKVTRTAAAVVAGLKQMEPGLDIAGIILNKVAGKRHEDVVKKAIESTSGIPVIGAIPKGRDNILPDRHLGLVTPGDLFEPMNAIERAAELVKAGLDIERLIEIASRAPRLAIDPDQPKNKKKQNNTLGQTKIGVFRDEAFCFYYPENLEQLESLGARLVFISPLAADSLPNDLSGLYIGGGFPEVHAERLAENKAMLSAVRSAAESGLPIYAECGGLMYLSETVVFDNKAIPMSGVFSIDTEVEKRPQGHGYVIALVQEENPFFPKGAILKGHEFHYSRVIDSDSHLKTVLNLKKGKGIGNGRDGLVRKNVMASYLHLHSSACPEWSQGILKAAALFKMGK